jgi:ribosomal-protein-alanine N-acetyltransferase
MTLLLRTDRLILRSWTPADFPAFAELNADPEVMEHFPATMTRQDSDAFATRITQHLDEHGWGLWAVEVPPGRFAGFTGLARPSFQAHFTPAVEVGWRLARWAWGHGYASEAARLALDVGFNQLGLTEIVSFTTVSNVRSQAVMRRIGMTRDPRDDFDHPNLPADHPLRRHVLYRIHPMSQAG